jgi:hypothetical protein
MLERLKTLFRVKEKQDFRTLYTDPPISFSEEYPDIPGPWSEFSPQLLAARWAVHDLYGEDMPTIAINLLEAGHDTPAIRRLAGEMQIACSEDVEKLVSNMFRELLVSYPLSESEANLVLTRQIAREVIAGKRNAWAAASNLTHAVWGRRADHHPDLRAISELLDSLNWEAVNQDRLPELTSELIAAFARLGAQTQSEKRMAAFGLLKGKGWIADDFDAPLPDDVLAEFEGREPKQS